jgi:hypothetical protein
VRSAAWPWSCPWPDELAPLARRPEAVAFLGGAPSVPPLSASARPRGSVRAACLHGRSRLYAGLGQQVNWLGGAAVDAELPLFKHQLNALQVL